jgi:uncharacterized membrane protein HdeD (DUF308 family)
LAGLLLIGSGLVKASQLFLGLAAKSARRKGWTVILWQVAVDLAMGTLLLNHRNVSVGILAISLATLFLVESAILFVMGVRSPTVRMRLVVWISAAAIAFTAVLAFVKVRENPTYWVGLVVGIKLLLFGAVLCGIAVSAPRGCSLDHYTEGTLSPIVGELYAVYFGTAFHLGVYVGDDHVVHYLDDDHVWHVTWEKFLDGRKPQHWSYPDLPVLPEAAVVATAMSEVGKTYPYSLLKHNCENFAIYCKSGGATRYSKFAQIPGSLHNVSVHPLIGMVAEVNTRIFEWLAFHLGGASGKDISLRIRRLGAIITTWVVTRGANKDRRASEQ